MSISLQRLLPLFERECSNGRPVVLATVLRTQGPTYSKPGALMLVAESGEYAGMLTGGCLEGDLAERSRAVFERGVAALAGYDMRGPDDLLFGLGSGCEGTIEILLQRLDAQGGWQPMRQRMEAWRAQRGSSVAVVGASTDARWPLGSGVFATDAHAFGTDATDDEGAAVLRSLARQCYERKCNGALASVLPGVDVLTLYQAPPSQILLLGAGPDAQPVAQLAGFLGWQVTVIDHREHYARAARFPTAHDVLASGPEGLRALLSTQPARFDAAIVMSHHFITDLAYLQVLAGTEIPYVGLLGPIVRRERLMGELGPAAARVRPRLRSPVGLDLGAAGPESIALAIAAEIHGTLAGREIMGPMSRKQESP